MDIGRLTGAVTGGVYKRLKPLHDGFEERCVVLREELAMMRTAFELKIELLKQEVLPECVCRGVRLRVSGC